MPEILGNVTLNTWNSSPQAHQLQREFDVPAVVTTLLMDGDLITANLFNGTVDGVAISEVTFITDHDATAQLVADAYAALPSVKSAILDPLDGTQRTILITLIDQSAPGLVTGVVTAGATQIGVTFSNNFAPIQDGTPVVLNADGTIKPLTSEDNLEVIGFTVMPGLAGEDRVTVSMKAYGVIEAIADGDTDAGPVKYTGFDATAARHKYSDDTVTAALIIGWATRGGLDGEEMFVAVSGSN